MVIMIASYHVRLQEQRNEIRDLASTLTNMDHKSKWKIKMKCNSVEMGVIGQSQTNGKKNVFQAKEERKANIIHGVAQGGIRAEGS